MEETPLQSSMKYFGGFEKFIGGRQFLIDNIKMKLMSLRFVINSGASVAPISSRK